jgi:hypothetical protein
MMLPSLRFVRLRLVLTTAVSFVFVNIAAAEEGMVAQVFGGSAGPHTLAIGDTISVQTLNLDGWLIAKIEKGYLNDDPFVTKYWKDYGPLITTREFNWAELLTEPLPPETTKKYGAPLEALRKKTLPENWQSTVREVRGDWNGFVRRKAGELRLVIDDVHFEKILPTTVHQDRGPSGDTIFYSSYKLERNAQNNATWQQLLRQFKFTRPVDLTLGLKLTNATWVYLPSTIEANRGDAEPLKIQLVSPLSFGAALGAIALALVLFAVLLPTDLLRDTDAALRPANKDKLLYPFSLARSQMAFWFFLVASAYLFIWLTTDRLDGINEQMLGLVGISAGTALGVAFISAGKGPCRTIKEEQDRAKDAKLTPAEQDAAQRRADRLIAQQERLKKYRPFMRLMDDWLTEDGAVSFHRFQMLAWTVILGSIFLIHVCANYAMPEFSGTTLALMGISSGTYLGFKLPDGR